MEEMATRSSILAWEIPWTEEPGGLQSMAEQRVRPDWETADTNTQVYKHFLRMPTQCQVAVQSFRNSRMNKARGWLSETLTFGEVKFHGG